MPRTKQGDGGEAGGAPSSNVARKRALKREALLARATQLFNARGIAGASIGEIAAALGLTRAALYYYVDDRDDLVFQCYLRACEQTAEDLAGAAEAGGSGFTQLVGFVGRTAAPERPPAAVLSEINALQPAHRQVVEAASRRNGAHLKAMVEAGIADGSIRPCDAEVIAQSVLGMLAFSQLSPAWVQGTGGGRSFRARVRLGLVDLLTQGTGTPGRRPPVCDIDAASFLPGPINAFDRAQVAELKAEQLMMTASRLFNRDGIEATSVDDIAEALGATKGVVYDYMEDKTDLVVRCYGRAFDLFEAFARTCRDVGRDGLERGMLGTHLNTQAQIGPLAPLMPQPGIDALPSPHRENLTRRAGAIRRQFTAFMREGMRDGSVRPCDAPIIAEIAAGAFGWLPKWVPEGAQARAKPIAEEIVALFTLGLKAS